MGNLYCPHPDEEVTVTPTNSMWGGADCYCSACGHHWYVTQNEVEAFEDGVLNPPLRTLEDIEFENFEGAI